MKRLIISLGLIAGSLVLYARTRPPQSSLSNGEPLTSQKPITTAPASETNAPWLTYQNAELGFSIDYPADGTYTPSVDVNQSRLPNSTISGVEPPAVIGSLVAICQSPLLFTPDTIADQQCFQIYVTPDPNILTTMPVSLEVSGTKLINGMLFQTLLINPEVSIAKPFLHDYAYAIQHNGRYFVFESHRGPDDPVFEHMMASLKFD